MTPAIVVYCFRNILPGLEQVRATLKLGAKFMLKSLLKCWCNPTSDLSTDFAFLELFLELGALRATGPWCTT